MAIKSGDKKVAVRVTENTRKQYAAILKYMKANKSYKAGELAEVIDVKASRIRIILNQMVDEGLIKSDGERKQRTYYK